MNKTIKIKLQALKEGECDVEEMFVNDEGDILRVIPRIYNEEYRGLNVYEDTCEVGKSPVFVRALAIYGLVLPCIVTEITDWTYENYSNYETILFYPVTVSEDYMEEIFHKDMGINLNKEDLFPLYQKYDNILGVEEYILNEQLTQISYPVRLYNDDLKKICKSRFPIASLMKQQLIEWRKVLPKAYFMLEYYAKFRRSDGYK